MNHPLDTPILVRIAERAQLASELQPREAVAPLRVHVSLDERRESCDVLIRELMSLSREFVHRSLQIARVKEDHDVQYQAERTDLVFLPLLLPLAQLAAVTMEDLPGE